MFDLVMSAQQEVWYFKRFYDLETEQSESIGPRADFISTNQEGRSAGLRLDEERVYCIFLATKITKFSKMLPNFGGLVLDCIEAELCK